MKRQWFREVKEGKKEGKKGVEKVVKRKQERSVTAGIVGLSHTRGNACWSVTQG